MYTLYYSPNACSLAIHTILNMLGQEVKIQFSGTAEDFATLSPTRMVPVLVESEMVLNEGAAIILYLLNKHANDLLPEQGLARQQAIQNLMLANATVHPAYSKLFFAEQSIADPAARKEYVTAAASQLSTLWQVIENQLGKEPFLGGAQPSAADVLLAVYSRWGQFFDVNIIIGPKAQRMIDGVLSSSTFQRAYEQELEDHRNEVNAK